MDNGDQKPVIPKARIAAITGDVIDERYIVLGVGDGTCERWKLTDSLLRKIRREINDRLD